jgi:hypothetical protein
MTPLRRLLVRLTALWLLFQIGTVTSVPVSLWIRAADRQAAECMCGHGVGATCPMHHRPTGGSAPCALQAASSPGTAILTALVGMAGVIAEPTASIRPTIPSSRVRAGDVRVAGERPVPPDPPPPRI